MDDLHKVLEQLKRVELTRSIHIIHVPTAAWNHYKIVRLREQEYLHYLCMLYATCEGFSTIIFSTLV